MKLGTIVICCFVAQLLFTIDLVAHKKAKTAASCKNGFKCDVKANKKVFAELWNDIDGFAISVEEEGMFVTQDDSTYGEIKYDSVQKLIKNLGLNEDSVVYDLGSGVGKMVAQFHVNSPAKKVVGFELCPSRHAGACSGKKRLQEKGMVDESREYSLLQQDITQASIDDATHIYCAATCLSDEIMDALVEKFATLKPGLIVATLQELPDLEAYGFVKERDYRLPMTWAKREHVYVYKLVG